MTTAATDRSLFTASRTLAADIKLAHSVFALPFALLAGVMACEQRFPLPADPDDAFWPGLWLLGKFSVPLALIVLAMFFARTVAMLANRLFDAQIDRANPRTENRALPSGRVSRQSALIALSASAAGFLITCYAFGFLDDNWWPALLAPLVLIWISAYALFKRFTALCHLYLGASLAISPLAAALAVHPPALGDQPALWLLSAMVLCWVAGFDIIYALQDVAVDRAQGLHSIPSRVGVGGALWISRLLHVIAAACLIAIIRIDPRFGAIFTAGVIVVIALLAFEHATVSRWGTKRIALAFFTLNGLVSCILGACGIFDIMSHM